jgi:hypothetical protein
VEPADIDDAWFATKPTNSDLLSLPILMTCRRRSLTNQTHQEVKPNA